MSNVIYTRIELAIIARLKQGLAKMAREVTSYDGEFDDEIGNVVAALPAVWVTFGGITDTVPTSTSRAKYLTTGTYVVMCGEKNQRSDAAGRRGGVLDSEVGSYPLLYAVRRLLSGQDLHGVDSGLKIEHLSPGRVRTMFNTRHNHAAFSIFAAEFSTKWVELALDQDRWPAPSAPEDPDQIFAKYGAKQDAPYPDVGGIDVNADLVGKSE